MLLEKEETKEKGNEDKARFSLTPVINLYQSMYNLTCTGITGWSISDLYMCICALSYFQPLRKSKDTEASGSFGYSLTFRIQIAI